MSPLVIHLEQVASGQNLSLEDLSKAEHVQILIRPHELQKSIELLAQLLPHTQEEVTFEITVQSPPQIGSLLKFGSFVQKLDLATLSLSYGATQTSLLLKKQKAVAQEKILVEFPYENQKVFLTYPHIFEMLRLFPIHMKTFYEIELLDYIRTLQKPGLFLDVGANIGNHSVYMGLFSGRQVYAFEPSPRTFQSLQKNIELNGLAQMVQIKQFGLSDQHKKVAIKSEQEDHSGITALDTDHDGPIEVFPLDHFRTEMDQRVAILKIDVEGMEEQVIKGASKILQEDKPIVFAEAHIAAEEASLKSLMAQYGYAYRQSHCVIPMLEFHAQDA